MKPRSIVIALYALIITLGAYLLYTYHYQKKKAASTSSLFKTIKAITSKQSYIDRATLVLEDLQLENENSDEQELTWTLSSTQCAMVEGNDQIVSSRVTCHVSYDAITADITAPQAAIDLKSKSIFLIGPIKACSDNIMLYGNDICYIPSEKQIKTDSPLAIENEHGKLTAQKMTAHLNDNTRVDLARVTTTIFTLPAQQPSL